MTTAHLLVAATAALLLLTGCGDDGAETRAVAENNQQADAGNNTVADDRGAFPLGDCDAEAPCTGGAECVALLDDLSACVVPPLYYEEASGCGLSCCASSACSEQPDGHCYFSTACSGIGCTDRADCVYDQCHAASDCGAGEVCVPAGSRGLAANACAPRLCARDADCTEGEDGECRLLGAGTLTAAVCTYADSPCRRDSECEGMCGIGVCSPRWELSSGQWILAAGVECRLDETCMMP